MIETKVMGENKIWIFIMSLWSFTCFPCTPRTCLTVRGPKQCAPPTTFYIYIYIDRDRDIDIYMAGWMNTKENNAR